MREPWLVLVPTWARADGLCGTPDMSPALNYKALLYATPTHLPSICPFTRPHVIISALSMHLPPVLWAWIRAPATHFLGARILTTLPLSIPPAAFSALPQHLPSPFSVIILSSQYLFQRCPIWVAWVNSIWNTLVETNAHHSSSVLLYRQALSPLIHAATQNSQTNLVISVSPCLENIQRRWIYPSELFIIHLVNSSFIPMLQ